MTVTIKPIKNQQDYEDSLKRVDELWGSPQDTPEGDELDVLLILIEAYEEKICPMPPSNPVEAIKFKMDQLSLKQKDLVPYIGQISHVSEVLNGKRELSLKMIKDLSKGLKIPIDVLIPL